MTTQELQTVLAISQTIATIREKSELLKLIIEQLQPLFNCYDCGLFVFNKDKTTLEDLTVSLPSISPSAGNQLLADDHAAFTTYQGSIFEWVFDRLRSANAPFVHQYKEDQVPDWVNYVQAPVIDSISYEESMVAVLRTGGDEIGVFMVNSLQKGTFHRDQYVLYQAIADQVAVAVANILANEEITERERQQTMLLNMAKSIASIQNRDHLLRVIYDTIRLFFPFDDSGIAILNEAGDQYYDLLTDQAVPSITNRRNAELGYFGRWLPVDGSMQQALRVTEPILVCIIDEANEHPTAPYLSVFQETGIQQCIGRSLVVGGKIIGCLNFNSVQRDAYAEKDFPLFNAIADQVAVAVANILANEEILEREWEKSQLLEITNLVAQVKVKEDLLKLIVDKIKPLFRFHDCGLFVLSVDGSKHSDLAALPGVDPSELNQMHASVSFGVPHQGSLIEWMIQEIEVVGGPVLFDFKDLVERYPDYPQFVAGTFLESGYRDCLAVNLVVRGKAIGLFCINALEKDFFQQDLFGLLLSVANTVAVAVANILANEEILEREREKTQLLAISQAIATVQESKQLLRVIYERIRPVLPFSDAGLFVINAQGNHRDLIVDEQVFETPASLSLQEQQLDGWLPDHPVLEYFLVQGPVQEALANMYARFPGHPHYPALQAAGYEHILGGALRQGGQTIGMLCFFPQPGTTYTATEISIFRSISDQVAVAVANILANEEILQREQEKSQLLEISQAIATVQNHKQLLKVIYEKIKPIFPYDNAGLFVFDKTGEWFQEILDTDVLSDAVQTELTATLDLGPFPVAGHHPNAWHYAQTPVICSLAEQAPYYDALSISHQFEVGLRHGLRQMIGGPLICGGRKIGLISFNAKDSNFYTQQNIPLFQAIADQVAVAVANILAKEEILEREREKTILLAISESIASARNAVELLSIIREKAQQLIPFYDTGILIIEPDGQHHYDLAVTMQGWDESEANQRLQKQGLARIIHPDSYIAYTMTLIEQAQGPIIEDLEQRCGQFDYPFFPIIKEIGLKEAMVTELKSGGKTIGTLWLNALEKNHFHPNQFDTFQALADQVAVAVANILANEEILQREQEKTVLLAISNAIATINDKRQLLKLTFEQVRPMFGFDDIGLSILEPDGQHFNDWAAQYTDTLPLDIAAKQLAEHRYPYIGSLIEQAVHDVTMAGHPLVYDLTAELVAQWSDAQTVLVAEIADQQKQALATTLQAGGKILGLLNINTKQGGHFESINQLVFQAIADQVAVAVANILANEEILNREREKSQLLEITELIAQVKATDDLLRLIVGKIKPLFRFHDCGLFVVSTDGQTHTDLAAALPDVSPSEWNQAIAAVSVNVAHQGSPAEWVMSELEVAGKPVLFDFRELVEKFPTYPQFEDTGLLEMGYRDCLAASLTVRGKSIGLFCINALEKNFFQPTIFPLFKSVTHNLSIAVANILANEEILKREWEKSILLSISESIASVRNPVDLLKVINEKIRQLIPYYDTGVLIVAPDGQYHYDMAVTVEHWDASEGNRLLQQQGHDRIPHQGSFVEVTMKELEFSETPLIRDWTQLFEMYEYPFFAVMEKVGYQEALVTTLKSGGRTFGSLWLNSLNKGHFSAQQYSLFQAVADQVAIAVANILANEEILQREQEKTVLLAISNAIATINDKRQLLTLIFEQVRPLFGFDDVGLMVIEKNGEYINDWAAQFPETLPLDIAAKQITGYRTPYPDSLLEQAARDVLAAGHPLVYRLTNELAEQWPNDEVYLSNALADQQTETLFTTLRIGGQLLGTFNINTKRAGHFSRVNHHIFQAIADQVAVAVANILANEEIKEREQEKSFLLSISQQLSTIRNQEDLFGTFIHQLKNQLPFDEALVVLYDESLQTRRYLYNLLPPPKNTLSDYQHLLRERLPVTGSPYEEIVTYEQPQIRTWLYWEARYPADLGLGIARDNGLVEGLYMPLYYGSQLLGTFVLHSRQSGRFTTAQLPLYSTLADQLAVAVANVLANEEILHREQEKANLLAISQAIAQVQNSKQLLRIIYEKIKPLFPYDNAGLYVFDPSGETYWGLLDSEVLPDEIQAQLEQANLMGPYAYKGHHPDLWGYAESAAIYSRSAQGLLFAEGSKERVSNDIIVANGLQQMIGGPLYCGGRKIGLLCFNAKQADFYQDKHISLFNAIADQIAVAVDNILANEEILRREQEKANLLAISTAIATIRDKDDLFRVITETVRPILGFDEAAQIFAIDPTDQTIGIFLRNTSRMISQDADYQQLTRQRFAIAGSPFEKILAWPTVYVLDPAEEAKQYPQYPGFPIMVRMGIRQSMITPLRYGGRTIGTFHVFSTRAGFFGPQHFAFYETVANQIAVAVANILANEELLQREGEKALQLAVSNALADGHDWDQKLLTLAKTIQPAIPFDYAIVGLETGGQIRHGYGFYRTGPDEYQILLADDFLRLSRLTAEQYTQMRQQLNDSQPLLLNGAEFEQHCRQFTLKRLISQTFRLQSHILFPIPLTREGRFTLAFYSRQGDTYQPYHLDLLQKLRPTLALALDRLLAYEEVAALSQQLQQENTYLQEEVRTNYRFEEIVGTSQAVRDVFQKVSKVGPMSSTVLILGETGTGKELVARAIHQASPRQAKPLIKINCAALPAQLIESELFGHEKGAFTGAIERRIGKFELAHESTIFLDEIGELPLELQAKLLRAIQEKEIERLGSNKVIQTDVRVLAATNRNLEKEVAEGRFRSDLYFRLNVYPIKLPPLRERKEDITLLAIHFSQKLSKKLGKAINGFSNGAIKEMQAYHWPGNIRELEHVIERAAIESEGGTIRNLGLLKRPEGELTVMINPTFQLKSYADGERELIMNTVRYCNGRIRGTGGAAQLLQVKATTLEARMKKLGIKREFFVNEGAGPSATN